MKASDGSKLIKRSIFICEDCYELKGEMCCTPECVFCWHPMSEAAEILDILKIRPVVNDERLRL